MAKFAGFAVALFTFLAGMAEAQPSSLPKEALNRPPNPGFILDYTADNGEIALEEWVPEGESVHKWTKMVTFQRLGNFKALGHTAFSAANGVAGLMIRSCPGATSTPINLPSPDGVSIAEFSTFCPLNSATGKPEATFFKFIAGGRDVHVAQAAFRRKANGADRKWALNFLSSVQLCAGPNIPNCGAIPLPQ